MVGAMDATIRDVLEPIHRFIGLSDGTAWTHTRSLRVV